MEERYVKEVDLVYDTIDATTSNDMDPVFPPELERLIFEMAMSCKDARYVDLMLVAKRFHIWLQSIPFVIFIQLDSEALPDFSRPDSGPYMRSLGKFCRHLLTEEDYSCTTSDSDSEEVVPETLNSDLKPPSTPNTKPLARAKTVNLLKSCPNVQNLALWFGFPIAHYLPYIENMPLRVLSADLSSLTEDQLSLPIFKKLTHLDVVDFSWIDDWQFLNEWTNLTHLAFNFEVDRKVVVDVLTSVKNIKAFVLVRNQVNWAHMDPEVLDNGDPRLVLMIIAGRAVVGDWKEGAKGNVDFWVFGDWVVEARHKSYFLDTSPRWHELVQWMTFDERLNDQGKKWFKELKEYYKESAETDPARP